MDVLERTAARAPGRYCSGFRLFALRFFGWSVLLAVAAPSSQLPAQILLSSGRGVVENFQTMGTSTTLPSGWKVSASLSPDWHASGSTGSVDAAANIVGPSSGGSINWGDTSNDRAVGAMQGTNLSGPAHLMARYRNNTGFVLRELSVAYGLERYRINTAPAEVSLLHSLNGADWSVAGSSLQVQSGELPTGPDQYTFSNPLTLSRSGSIGSFTVAQGSDVYLRWHMQTGAGDGATSQGLGIDDVAVRATRLGTAGSLVQVQDFFTGPAADLVIENGSSAARGLVEFAQTVDQVFAGTLRDGAASEWLSVRKTGSGALTLSGDNRYTGSTSVFAGRLIVTSGAAIRSGNSSVGVGGGGGLRIEQGGTVEAGVIEVDGATLHVDGSLSGNVFAWKFGAGATRVSGAGSLTGGLRISPGAVLAPGGSPSGDPVSLGSSLAKLDLVGRLALLGTFDWQYDAQTGQADLVTVRGNVQLDQGSSVLNAISLGGTPMDGDRYTLIAYSGSLSGGFSLTSLPSGWQIDYASAVAGLNGTGGLSGSGVRYVTLTYFSAIPEPSSLVLVFIAGATAFLRPRRRAAI